MNDDVFNNPYYNNPAYNGKEAVNNDDPCESDVSFQNINVSADSTPVSYNDKPVEDISSRDAESTIIKPLSEAENPTVNNSDFVGNSDNQPSQQPQPPYSYEWYGRAEERVNDKENFGNIGYYVDPIPPRKTKERKGVTKGMFFVGIAICLCLSFIAGFSGTMVFDFMKSVNTEVKNGISINKVDAQNHNTAYKDSGLSTVEIVSKTADSVVEITTETVTTGVFAQQFIKSGAGSGVIVDAAGFIVTNHHVIDGATKISVSLRDGSSFDARLVGSDEKLDVALLEITPDTKLTAATFGDSDVLMVGQRTVAIGNPLGQLGGSVTEGILSALNRDVVIDGQTMSLLQTDTAINPGNSGGGLFDQNGNLIGIVNAKSSGSEVEGLGFAIPINDVINVIGDLSEYGYVRGRVSLGMTFIDVESKQTAWMYGLDKTGCYIYSVDNNTNADLAGFESGDRVISVNGNEIATSDDVEDIIDQCAVGEEVTFKVENTSGKTYNISFELEEYIPETENDNFFENNNPINDFSYWWSEFN